MTTIFQFDTDGAFITGDTETGRTAYAYPTSAHAEKAKRNPEKVADEMIGQENSYSGWRDIEEFRMRDAERIRKMQGRTL